MIEGTIVEKFRAEVPASFAGQMLMLAICQMLKTAFKYTRCSSQNWWFAFQKSRSTGKIPYACQWRLES